ncbi:MAG: KEOPS complex subunit Pcc1 [Candidatus Hydrothermarchaeaceae archaeon]
MDAGAEIEIDFDSEEEAERVLMALKPELSSAPSDKTEVTLEVRGKTLFLGVSSGERAPFRAAVNTYMRWIRTAHEIGGL